MFKVCFLLMNIFWQFLIGRYIMCKIKFFKSHELLLQEKLKTINQVNLMLDRARDDYQASLNIIAVELGINESDLKKWKVSLNQEGLERKNKDDLKEIKK